MGQTLLKGRNILVLDEATALVDSTTDNITQQTLHYQFFNSTVIAIAHRISIVVDSDLVLVLKDGIAFIMCLFS